MTERGFYPRAIIKNIPPGSNDPAITPRLAILHVDAGNSESLFEYFRDRSGGVESHFFVKKTGEVEQYRSIYFQADANLDANNFAVSIETQGFEAGEWTPAQLASIKRLLVWLRWTAKIPLRPCKAWDGDGVGYHVMFGAPGHWTPSAKTCPGPARIKQFNDVLVPWLATATIPRSRLRWTTANLDFVRAHDADYLAHLCESADVLLVQEAKDVRLADVLPEGWTALQDTTDEAHMGSAIAYRNETVSAGKNALRLTLGATPFWQGKRVQMLTRYIATAHLRDRATGEWRYAVAAHLPPRRFRFLQPGMTRQLREVAKDHPHAVIGVDANQPLGRLGKALGLRSFGEGIVGILVGTNLRTGSPLVDTWGVDHSVTDHPAVTIRAIQRSKA